MEIIKGNRYVCLREVSTIGGKVEYKKGNIYLSERDSCITDESGDKYNSWPHNAGNSFLPYSQLDKVYTKHTPLLEKIFDKYEGKKSDTSWKISFFDNVANQETGWFVSTGGLDEGYYIDEGYTYLSESAFIEFMDLGKYVGSPLSTIPQLINIMDERADSLKKEVFNPKPYYDNSNGSLYKVATERDWNAYLFDVVKRLERGGKKDPLRQEIEKSIDVLKIWLSEID